MKVTTAAFAALAAVMVAGCSPATISRAMQSAYDRPAAPVTIVAEPAAQGVEGETANIPWSQVGPGWVLATWNPVPGRSPGEEPAPGDPSPETAATTLYLVDPAGVRYPITTFPADGHGSVRMVDWSGDGTRALFYRSGSGSAALIEIDLRSGKQTTIPVNSSSPQYTLPQGKALLVATQSSGSKPGSLVRVDLSGKQQMSYPVAADFQGRFLSTPDGIRLVLDAAGGLALMGNDGTPGKALPVASEKHCDPLRWWDSSSTVVVARCSGAEYDSQLWLVPVDGTAPTALTAPNNGQTGPDYGDLNAWQLPSGTFIQAAGACGVVYLAKLNADGTTSPVSVPDVDGKTIQVIGVNGTSLRLHARAACGGGKALVDYNPATGTSTVLLGGPVNGGSVVTAVPYPGQS
jgi:hypothetical protein